MLKLDHEAVVTFALDANDGGQSEAGLLVVADLREAEIHLGLKAVDELTLWGPGIVVGGVAKSSTNWNNEFKITFVGIFRMVSKMMRKAELTKC